MKTKFVLSSVASAMLLLGPSVAEASATKADGASAAAVEEMPASSAVSTDQKLKRKGAKKRTKRPGVRKFSDKSRIKRRPVYFGAGFGAGASSLSDSKKWGALAGSFSMKLGAAIKDQWLVGIQSSFMAQFNRWAENEPTGAMLSNVMADFTAYPMAHIPWNVTAAIGWGSAGAVSRRGDVQGTPIPVGRSGNGVSWVAGAGWDFFPGRGTNLGLQLRYEGTQSGNIGVDHGGMLILWTTLH